MILSSCQLLLPTNITNPTTPAAHTNLLSCLTTPPISGSSLAKELRKRLRRFLHPGGLPDLADGTAAEQQRIIDDLLAKGIKGIAISPVDPANQTAMLDRAAAQAVVVTQDSDAPTSKRECYIGTDNVAAGRLWSKPRRKHCRRAAR